MNKIIHYIGLDVHKDSIAVSSAPQNSTEVRRYGIIGGTLDAVDKLIKKLSTPNVELRLVYEAGPCGFVLCRHLRNKGMVCDVVVPSLIPKKASDRVKTDRRDADQLARLDRAGELTAIQLSNGLKRWQRAARFRRTLVVVKRQDYVQPSSLERGSAATRTVVRSISSAARWNELMPLRKINSR